MRCILALCLSLLAAAARAESLDCTAPRGAGERTLCGDTDLARRYEEVEGTYERAARATPTPQRLARGQAEYRTFVLSGAGKPADMRRDIEARKAVLDALLDGAPAARRPVSLVFLRKACLSLPRSGDFGSADCRPEGSGEIVSADGETFAYQMQGYFDGERRIASGAVVLAVEGTAGQAIAWLAAEDLYAERPRLVETPAGTMLHIPATEAGTQRRTDDLVLQREGKAFVEIDAQSWKAALRERLPFRYRISRGVTIDLASMTADSNLWGEGDPDCCGRAGRVDVTLALTGRRLEIASLTIREGADWANREPRLVCGKRLNVVLDPAFARNVPSTRDDQELAQETAARAAPALFERAANELCETRDLRPDVFARLSTVVVQPGAGAVDPVFFRARQKPASLVFQFAWNGADTPSLASVRAGLACFFKPKKACAGREP